MGGADEEALKNSHWVGIPWYDQQLLEFLRGNIAAESSVSELLDYWDGFYTARTF